MTKPVDIDDMEKTKDRATIIIKSKVVRKFEESDGKKFECEIIAQDA
jgi:hypothetical protein